MSNFDKRMKQINKRLDRLIAREERTIARRYALTLTEIRKLMTSTYEKYEQGGKLSLNDMLRYDRLNKLMKEFDQILKAHYKGVYKDIYKSLGEVYQDGYYLTAWAVESEVARNLSYSAVSSATLQNMVVAPVAGLTLNQRLEKQRIDVIYTIQQTVTNGLQKNYTYATMAKELKGALEDDADKAMRIVRTEGHRVQESAKLDSAQHAELGGVVMSKEWNSSEDSRVRDSKANHRRLNGKVIPIDEDFDDGLGKGPAPGQLGAAGSDINCRCFLTYKIVDITEQKGKKLEEVAFDKWKDERLRGVA